MTTAPPLGIVGVAVCTIVCWFSSAILLVYWLQWYEPYDWSTTEKGGAS